jgi:hypothetical protein
MSVPPRPLNCEIAFEDVDLFAIQNPDADAGLYLAHRRDERSRLRIHSADETVSAARACHRPPCCQIEIEQRRRDPRSLPERLDADEAMAENVFHDSPALERGVRLLID